MWVLGERGVNPPFRVMMRQMMQCMLARGGKPAQNGRTMIRFSLFGVRVTIHPTLWLMLAALGGLFSVSGLGDLLGVAVFAMAGLLCLLVHEMGHALVGSRLGGGSPEIWLAWLGGACNNPDSRLTRVGGVLMTMSGPAASVLLGLFAVAALGAYIGSFPVACYIGLHALAGVVHAETWLLGSSYLILFFICLIQVCFWWSVFNLLPVFPLDGGQIMHGLMESPRRMHFLSLLFACLLMAGCAVLGLWLIAILMFMLAALNYRCVQQAPY